MRCAREVCARWVPDFLAFARPGHGLVFDEAWYCSRPCLEAEARARLEQAPAPDASIGRGQNVSRLGALLVHRRLISTATLEEALIRQETSGQRLGAELVAMGALQPLDLLRTLATQSRAGYLTVVDVERARPAPGGLSRDVVETLGIVPIEADDERGRLVVACPAPLPRLALAVLRNLVTATVEPLLVADEAIADLLDAYGTAPRRAPRVTRTLSLGDAAQRIAAAIESGRVSRVQPVRCEPWVWVRLDGGVAPEEIVLPSRAVRVPERAAAVGKDPAWLAAPTAH
jgi:type II secretion system (T2SS) protein E